MKVDTLIERIGSRLSEDFDNSTIWTKAELLESLKVVLKRFSTLTKIVDRHSIRIVNTSGLSSAFLVPEDFNEAFYVTYNQKNVDLVRFNDMDFVGSGWTNTDSAPQPLAASQVGAGSLATISLVPSPSAAAGAFGSGLLEDLFLESADGTVWEVTINAGTLSTTSGGSGTPSTPVIAGPSTTWQLTIDNAGALITTSASGSVTNIFLEDVVDDFIWFAKIDDAGVFDPVNVSYGLTTSIQLNGAYQTFSAGDSSTDADYGVVVDAYATGVSTTPDSVVMTDKPVGEVNFYRNMDNAATLYYVGSLEEPQNLESTIFIHDAFVPVVEHGVLAMAYWADNAGRDPDKAKVLNAIFEAECNSIRETFGRR